MGFLDGLFGGGGSSSTFETRTLPGVFGPRRRIGTGATTQGNILSQLPIGGSGTDLPDFQGDDLALQNYLRNEGRYMGGAQRQFQPQLEDTSTGYEESADIANYLYNLIKTPSESYGMPAPLNLPQAVASISPQATVGGVNLPGAVGGINIPGAVGQVAESPYRMALRNALTSPSFAPQTESESALLKDISAQTQGAAALRGLGPATEASLAQNLAPTLVNLRQQRVSNLMSALGQEQDYGVATRGQDITDRGQTLQALLEGRGQDVGQRGQTLQALLEGRGQDVGQRGQTLQALLEGLGLDVSQRGQTLQALLEGRGQDINAGLTARGQDLTGRAAVLQSLLELAGLAMPQTIGGTTSTSTGPGLGYGLLTGLAGGYGVGRGMKAG